MQSVFDKTVFRVNGDCPCLFSDGVVVKAASPADAFYLIDFSCNNTITLTAASCNIYFDQSRDFSVACDPLAQAGLCISLLGEGLAERNWQELIDCRLNFSVCGTAVLPKNTRKLSANAFHTTIYSKAERFTAARCARRQEVLRL